MIYTNGSQSCLVASKFIYESTVFLYHKNVVSLCNKNYYQCDKYIDKLVESFFVTPNIELRNELHAAPIAWLKANGYKEYIKIKKERKPKIKKKNE